MRLIPLLLALALAIPAYAGWHFTLHTEGRDSLPVSAVAEFRPGKEGPRVILSDGIGEIYLTPTEANLLASALNAAAEGKLEP